MAPEDYNGLPVLSFENAAAWEKWLKSNHAKQSGIWIKLAKKGSGLPSISYEQALIAALCYGWIDGQLKSLGSTHHLQRFTPRRDKSVWSKKNVERVNTLISQGKMQPAGMAAVEAAKSDGRWDRAYDSPSNSSVPKDLAAAFEKNSKAKEVFAGLDRTNVYAILRRIQIAATPKTRAARIERFVTMLERGETIHPMAKKVRKKAQARKSRKTSSTVKKSKRRKI